VARFPQSLDGKRRGCLLAATLVPNSIGTGGLSVAGIGELTPAVRRGFPLSVVSFASLRLRVRIVPGKIQLLQQLLNQEPASMPSLLERSPEELQSMLSDLQQLLRSRGL